MKTKKPLKEQINNTYCKDCGNNPLKLIEQALKTAQDRLKDWYSILEENKDLNYPMLVECLDKIFKDVFGFEDTWECKCGDILKKGDICLGCADTSNKENGK